MRKPDLIIGNPTAPVYYRWQLFKFRGWQLCLHKWMRSDDDRALHDHSGHNISLILNKGYVEVVREWYEGGELNMLCGWEHHGDGEFFRLVRKRRRPFVPYFRRADDPHRVEIPKFDGPVWSLWLRFPPFREWGFYCPKGWRHWRDYCDNRGDYYATGTSEIGPGCN